MPSSSRPPAPRTRAAARAREQRRARRRRAVRSLTVGTAVVCALALVVAGTVWMIAPPGGDGPQAPSAEANPDDPGLLDRAQRANARTIIGVGRPTGVGREGMIIALMVALQESTLHNLDHGDRDSVGLFQQRPSQGWGTKRQLQDPRYAARAFYGVERGSDNRGLRQIKGWRTMTKNDAGQRVQRSAYPHAYAKWEALATALYDKERRAPIIR
ncbi:peptidoglycan-binding protein [Brevibacterium sp. 5221]|uniref:Peptidoglycan-binding protein n=1 Tax=Brevibacterium rongguiense TaxID=2695267 RepID=A0A6N9H5C0_9MICO|nr:peptidoglycan-binding protein [Brevibacterium rongguiense]MYM19258.1 peptidoglycan-binding protein [Brevibacterium rongguiense]